LIHTHPLHVALQQGKVASSILGRVEVAFPFYFLEGISPMTLSLDLPSRK
jgi:hypothetical protein